MRFTTITGPTLESLFWKKTELKICKTFNDKASSSCHVRYNLIMDNDIFTCHWKNLRALSRLHIITVVCLHI